MPMNLSTEMPQAEYGTWQDYNTTDWENAGWIPPDVWNKWQYYGNADCYTLGDEQTGTNTDGGWQTMEEEVREDLAEAQDDEQDDDQEDADESPEEALPGQSFHYSPSPASDAAWLQLSASRSGNGGAQQQQQQQQQQPQQQRQKTDSAPGQIIAQVLPEAINTELDAQSAKLTKSANDANDRAATLQRQTEQMTIDFNASINAINGRIAGLAAAMQTLEAATQASATCLKRSTDENRRLPQSID